MSDFVRALVWRGYDQKRFGAPRILAIALSDESDDRGGGIFQSAAALSKKTEQTLRAVRGQLRRLEESGFLIVVERSAGGPGQFNHYRIDLGVLVMSRNGEAGAPLTVNEVHRSTPANGEAGSPLAGPLYKDLKDNNVAAAPPFTVGADPDDLKLAEWMYGRLTALNPKHRAPSWAAWCKDVRLMREKDGRSRREICDLFAFANADDFWRSNILSPGTLRKQWDRLELKRRGAGKPGAQSMARAERCGRVDQGAQCEKPAVFWDREGRGLCRECRELAERELVGVK